MTEDRMTPVPDARPARTEGRATVIVCGQVAGLAPPASSSPPCYQALDPWGRPDAGLPWFHIGTPPSGPALPASGRTLPEILAGTRWLLLVTGPGHDSLSVALALASWARTRGLRIAVLNARASATSSFLRRTLRDGVDYCCDCPPGLDALAAARALALGAAAAEAARSHTPPVQELLQGEGQLLWRPADSDGSAGTAVADWLRQLPSPARRAAFAVLVEAPAVAAASPDTPLHVQVQGLPATPGLAAGSYLFCA